MFALDVLTVLQQALLVTPGTDAFAGTRALVPADGDGPYTVVTATSGIAPKYCHTQPQPWLNQPGVQVKVHARTLEAAFALAQSCYDLIARVTNRAVGATFYLAWRPQQPPFDAGQDSVGRCTVAFNVLGMARG